ncbi:MAG: hypothetical protein NVS1B13_06580 [Flavisolibacter sp.]
MNNAAWRYLKLSSDPESLEYLQSIERVYLSDPKKMESWIEKKVLIHAQMAESATKTTLHNNIDSSKTRKKQGKAKSKPFRKNNLYKSKWKNLEN